MRRLITLMAILPLAIARSARADSQEGASAGQNRARGSVFRLTVKTSKRLESAGSAVLLALETKGAATRGYFATCYHVMQGGQSFQLEWYDRTRILNSGNCELFAWPDRDLVIFRGPITKKKEDLRPVLRGKALARIQSTEVYDLAKLSKALNFVPPPANDKSGLDGQASGYPRLSRRILLSVNVSIWGRRNAHLLELLSENSNTDAKKLDLGFLGNEITLPGMSGGLVASADFRFAGLTLGRLPDQQGLMIPAEVVLEALKLALADGLQPFKDVRLNLATPFNDSVRKQLADNSPDIVSKMTWESFGQWEMAFKADRAQADLFEHFQEVGIPLSILADTDDARASPRKARRANGNHARSTKVVLILFAEADDDRAAAGYTASLNGAPDEKFRRDAKRQFAANLELKPGENLLVISRRSRGKPKENVFSLSKLNSEKNRIEFSVRIPGGRTSYRVIRALPAIVSRYSIYVTLFNDLVPPEKPPAHDARLLIRLGYFKSLLDHTRHSRDISRALTRTGSYVDARVRFDQFAKMTYRPRTGPFGGKLVQSIDADVPVTLNLRGGELNQFGLRLKLPQIKPTLILRTRLQALPPGSTGTLSIRALAASCEQEIGLRLGQIEKQPVVLDIRGLAGQLTVAELNQQAFAPNAQKQLMEDVLGVANKERPVLVAARLIPSRTPGDGWLALFFNLGSGRKLTAPLIPSENSDARLGWYFHASELPLKRLPPRYRAHLPKAVLEMALRDVTISAPLALAKEDARNQDRSLGEQLRDVFWHSTAAAGAKGNLQLRFTTPPKLAFKLGKKGDLAQQIDFVLETCRFKPAGDKGRDLYRMLASGRINVKLVHFKSIAGSAKIKDLSASFELDTIVESGRVRPITLKLSKMNGTVIAGKETDKLETKQVRLTIRVENGNFAVESVPCFKKIMLRELIDPKKPGTRGRR